MRETPLLVDVSNGSFDDYLKSLAKTGRKNFNYVKKHNSDLQYSRIECDLPLIEDFMVLWGQQDKKGGVGTWGFGTGFIEFLMNRRLLLCFAATRIDTPEQIIALHFVEKHGDYVECHPPMFDKEKYNDRYLAKYMWFKLIEYALNDSEIKWLDFCAGSQGSWRDILISRSKNPDSYKGYKWLYVPKHVKEAPDKEPPYIVKTRLLKYSKYLETQNQPSSKLKNLFINKYVTWVWLHRKRRWLMLLRMVKKFRFS